MDDQSDGGGIPGDSELADTMDGVALDETKLSKVTGRAGGGGGRARRYRSDRAWRRIAVKMFFCLV